MKFTTSALLCAFAFSAMSVFADAANTLITFSTTVTPSAYLSGPGVENVISVFAASAKTLIAEKAKAHSKAEVVNFI